MRSSRSRVSGHGGLTSLLAAFLIAVPAGASADENKVTITMGNPGDHWLDTMQFLRVARGQRDKHFGYEVTYLLPGMGEYTLFWPRSRIDLDGSAPRKYRMQFMKLEQGRLYLPDRITSVSLPGVYKAIITIEDDYKKQARGGKAAAEAFTIVVTMTGALPARGSSLAARTSTSRTSTSASVKPSTAKPSAAKPSAAKPNTATATVGGVTNSAEWTPAMTRQLDNATQVFRNGPLTKVGRALTKHPNIIGESGNLLQQLGGATQVNAAGVKALENIMRTGTMTTKSTKAYGDIIQYTLESGLGARFSATTGEFIGFIGRGI